MIFGNPTLQQIMNARLVVMRSPRVKVEDYEGIVKLFSALTPELGKTTVDLEKIATEAFPLFEQTLGSTDWKKIQKYFGFGNKKNNASRINAAMAASIVDRMRTIENATKYISGFDKLMENYAAKLTRCPEDMTTLERAKFVRMVAIIWTYYQFFLEDFAADSEGKVSIMCDRAKLVNDQPLNPGQMKFLYEYLVKQWEDGSILYDEVMDEFARFDNKTRNEILAIAELRIVNGQVKSINQRVYNLTFGKVRETKCKMFKRMGFFPTELYYNKTVWKTRDSEDSEPEDLDFGEIYAIYNCLKKIPFESFPVVTRQLPYVDGKKISMVELPYYLIKGNPEMPSDDDICISDEFEKDRYIAWVDFLARKNFQMPIQLVRLADNDERKIETYSEMINVGSFFAYLDIARKYGDLSESADINTDVSRYFGFVANEKAVAVLESYRIGEISDDEVKAKLDALDSEEEIYEVVQRFADQKQVQYKNFSKEVVETVLISGNEEIWHEFATGSIDANQLMTKLGMDEEFLSMFFDLANIDIAKIEEKLMELKSSRMSRNIGSLAKKCASVIRLYCYVIEGRIACGKKNKAPKGNKALKPKNLKMMLEAA